MGHGNEVVTLTIYTHLFDTDSAAAADALDAAYVDGVGDNVLPFPKQA